MKVVGITKTAKAYPILESNMNADVYSDLISPPKEVLHVVQNNGNNKRWHNYPIVIYMRLYGMVLDIILPLIASA